MKTFLKTSASAIVLAGAMAAATAAQARDQIQIVGSSTVFPFSTAVAERFGQNTSFGTPVVESTGSGGGMKLFCTGVGEQTPDVTNASRRIKEKEFKQCVENGVTPVEVKVGFDGIVLGSAKGGIELNLTRADIYGALAKNIEKDGKVVANDAMTWADVNPDLPAIKIEVLGPPPTSGTRDAFVELVMEKSCPEAVEAQDEDLCTEIREDGAFVEAGENDNLIVQKLEANPNAVGIFGYSFLDQNSAKLRGANVDGNEPTFDNIASGNYPISRSLYFYVKKEHVGVIPGIEEFLAEFTDEDTWGPDGYLAEKGLIPLPEADRASVAADAQALKPLSM